MRYIVLLIATGMNLVCAQTPPRFEVASLKPGAPLPPGTPININLGGVLHGTLVMTNTSLADCLRYAWSLPNNDLVAGPDWIKDKSVRFDIVAKAPAGASQAETREMLQTLLTERFQLAVHHEPKVMPYLALVPARKGSKLEESKPDTSTAGNIYNIGRIASSRVTMQTLVLVLSRFLRQPIVDASGLKGEYEVKLEWAPDPPLPNAPDSDLPSIYNAIEAQLGLRLETRKGPLDLLVVDHAERVPLGN